MQLTRYVERSASIPHQNQIAALQPSASSLRRFDFDSSLLTTSRTLDTMFHTPHCRPERPECGDLILIRHFDSSLLTTSRTLDAMFHTPHCRPEVSYGLIKIISPHSGLRPRLSGDLILILSLRHHTSYDRCYVPYFTPSSRN